MVVQAGDTAGETLDLLALAGTTPRLAGVVGWVDLDGPDVRAAVAALRAATGRRQARRRPSPASGRARPRLPGQARRTDGLAVVAEAGLAYDVVVSPWQLPLVTETAAALPGHGSSLTMRASRRWPQATWGLAGGPGPAGRTAQRRGQAERAGHRGGLGRMDPGRACRPPLITCLPALAPTARWPAPTGRSACWRPATARCGRRSTPVLGTLDAAGRAAVLGGTAARWYRTRRMMQARPLRGMAVSRARVRRRLPREPLPRDVRRRGAAGRGRGLGRRRTLLRHRAALRPRAVRTPARRGAGRPAAGRLRAVHQGRTAARAQPGADRVRPGSRRLRGAR